MCSFCVISTLATSGNERVKTKFDTGLHKHKSGAMGHRALLKHSLDLITVKYIVHLVILHASDFWLSFLASVCDTNKWMKDEFHWWLYPSTTPWNYHNNVEGVHWIKLYSVSNSWYFVKFSFSFQRGYQEEDSSLFVSMNSFNWFTFD